MQIITISDVRAQGFDEVNYPDVMVEEAITVTDAYFEQICDHWFVLRDDSRFYNGNSSAVLPLDIPLFSLSKLYFSLGDSWQEQDKEGFVLHREMKYPRIEARGCRRFPPGRLSVKVEGQFGCVDISGQTPAPIRRAALELVPIYLGTLITHEPQERLKRLMLYEEETEDHRYKIAEAMTTGLLTGIATVDRVLARYKKAGTVSNA